LRTQLILSVLVATSISVGCETVISADDYDRGCMQNEQCMLILVGPVCGCECTFSAINSESGAQYLEDRGDISCDEDCAPCPNPGEAWCDDGTCDVH